MTTELAARALMGMSLGFHIVYAALGIGIPLLLLLAEGISLKTGDEDYHRMARGWARTSAVLFAIGAVSGTALSFELGFLFPYFMDAAGPMIGLPFTMEGFAFFLEAIFLGLYLYGEKRLSRRALFLATIPIAVGSAASAVFVISVNAWMNSPEGFATLTAGSLADGIASVNPLDAMTTSAWPHMAVHGTIASYVAAGLAVAGFYAWSLLRNRSPLRDGNRPYDRKAMTLSLGVATAVIPLMAVSGHLSAQSLADDQPRKLAAMEAHFETREGAPLILGGIPNPDTGEVALGIPIPRGLSLLAHNDPNAAVTGLEDFPRDTWPNTLVVHWSFDAMVLMWLAMMGAAAWFWIDRIRRRESSPDRRLLKAIVGVSPLGMLAIEAGWFVTEFGRQPFIVREYMRVSEAVTPREGIWLVLLVFFAVYSALTVMLIWLLLRATISPAPAAADTSEPAGPKTQSQEGDRS
ncbi:MAG: cytochrome ubiquinol oxidase subunit I [Thermoleophilia bacterium]